MSLIFLNNRRKGQPSSGSRGPPCRETLGISLHHSTPDAPCVEYLPTIWHIFVVNVGNYSSPMDPMGTLDWTPPKKHIFFKQHQESKPRLFDLKRIGKKNETSLAVGIIAWLQSHKGGPQKSPVIKEL